MEGGFRTAGNYEGSERLAVWTGSGALRYVCSLLGGGGIHLSSSIGLSLLFSFMEDGPKLLGGRGLPHSG